MTYLEYFELTQEPFSNAPVSRFYYNSSQHSQALTRLLHTVSYMKGLSVLIGDIGAGKTTLARRMLDSLPEDEYEAALLVIIHSGITANWLLKRIALQLGVENPAQEKLALLSQLYQRLLQIYESGKKAVVLIDEAQMLETRELMEEFRGLLNLEVPERKLISFVFFGLPEIEKNLKLDPPLAQRVAMRYRLEPFTADSTEAYIKHRLRLAGCPRMPFTPDAIEALHRRSGGTPRVINTLCDNALFEAFLARTPDIGAPLIEQIANNLGLETGLHGKKGAAQAVAPPVPASAPAPVVAPAAPTAPGAPYASLAAAQPRPMVMPAVTPIVPSQANRRIEPRPTPPVAAPIPEIAKPPVPPVPPVTEDSVPEAALPEASIVEDDVEIVTSPEAPIDAAMVEVQPPAAPPLTPGEEFELPVEDEPHAEPPVVEAQAAAPEAATDPEAPSAASPPNPNAPNPADPSAQAQNPQNPQAPGGTKPAGRGVDLAEIDRYLEGLNKL